MPRKRGKAKFPMTVGTPDGIQTARRMRSLANALIERTNVFGSLGKSFGTDRDLYTACGYPKNPQFEDYMARYQRQDIARRLVDIYPNATWKGQPEIRESADSDPKKPTAFEQEWMDLVRELKVWHYLLRADRVSGVGRFGILLIGYQDSGADFSIPVQNAQGVLYLQCYDEGQVTINSWNGDKQDTRFGLPETYTVELVERGTDSTTSSTFVVHWSRVIHIADGVTTDDVYGHPRLKDVYNRLQDIETIMGAAAESYWKAGWPGMSFEAMPDADLSPQDMDDLEEHIESYMHGLIRYLRLQGMTAKPLNPNISDPTPALNAELMLVAGAKGIPVRQLTGSERGELASSQDDENFWGRVDERRADYAEPMILRRFIDSLISYGVLAEPKEGPDAYEVIWPEFLSLTEKEEAEIALARTNAIAKYAATPGIEFVMPPEYFLREIMRMDPEEIEQMMEAVRGELEREQEELEQAEADAAAMALEAENQLSKGKNEPTPKGDSE